MNTTSYGMAESQDEGEMEEMMKMVKEFVAQGMSKNEAMKKAMGIGTYASDRKPMPMTKDEESPLEDASEGGEEMEPMDILNQIALAKKSKKKI